MSGDSNTSDHDAELLNPLQGIEGLLDHRADDDTLVLSDDDYIDVSDNPNTSSKQIVHSVAPTPGGNQVERAADPPPEAVAEDKGASFASGKQCPRCMRTVSDFTKQTTNDTTHYFCPACNQEVPFGYVVDYARSARVKFSLAGLSGHGKTMFLQGLYNYLNLNRANWEGFSFHPLSDDDAKTFDIAVRGRGALPDPSQLVERAVCFRLRGIPGVKNVHLLIYDISGEAFNTSATVAKNAFFLQHSEVITLILSPSDLESGHDPMNLLRRMVEAIEAKGETPKNKSLIVVFTKGDKLRGNGLPESAEDVLCSEISADPRQLTKLEQLSNELEGWIKDHPGNYWNFVNFAKSEFQKVRYTIISSIGSDPGPNANKTRMAVNPRNVAAPLMWLLRLSLPIITVIEGGKRSVFYDFHDATCSVTSAKESPVTIELETGDYYTSGRVDLKGNFYVIGKGCDLTRLMTRSDSACVTFSKGHITAKNIAFFADGVTPGATLEITDANVTIQDCSFSSAIRDQSGMIFGCGLRVDGVTSGQISRCRFSGNQGSGLWVGGQANLRVNKCTASENKYGIYLRGHAKATLSGNLCCNNKSCGVIAAGDSCPIIELNTCCGNGGSGISLRERCSVKLSGNHCSDNRYGIDIGNAVEISRFIYRNPKNRCNREQDVRDLRGFWKRVFFS